MTVHKYILMQYKLLL